MIRHAISPRFAMSSEEIIPNPPRPPSHPEHAEARVLGNGCVQARRESETQHVARLDRIDDPVVPQPCGRIISIALILVALADRRLEGFGFLRTPAVGILMHGGENR